MRDKEVAKLIKQAQKQGWSYRLGKHHVLTSPEGKMVVIPQSGSDWRGMRNLQRYLKKAGLIDA